MVEMTGDWDRHADSYGAFSSGTFQKAMSGMFRFGRFGFDNRTWDLPVLALYPFGSGFEIKQSSACRAKCVSNRDGVYPLPNGA
jgi:hypothetical protein